MKANLYVMFVAVACCNSLSAQVSGGEMQYYRCENNRHIMLFSVYPGQTYSFLKYSKSTKRQWSDTGYFSLRKKDNKIKFKTIKKTSFSQDIADMDLYMANNCVTDGEKIQMKKLNYQYDVKPIAQAGESGAVSSKMDKNNWNDKIVLSNQDGLIRGCKAADSMCKAPLEGKPAKIADQKRLQFLSDSICKPYRSDSLKFVAICKYVMSKLKYDYTFKKSVSPIEALANGETVCAGYAAIVEILSRNAGIPCSYVVGYAINSSYKWEANFRTKHAWNLVKLNNVWYMVDVTWMDNLYSNGIIYKNTPYFLTRPELMARTHFPDVFELTFSTYYGDGLIDYLKNPVTSMRSENLQLLEPSQNIIMAGDEKKRIVIYAKSADTVYFHNDADHLLPKYEYYLSPGINVITYDAKNINAHYYIGSKSFDAVFLLANPDPKERYRQFIESDATDKYSRLFYESISSLLDSNRLPVEVRNGKSDTTAWKALLRDYDGRLAHSSFGVHYSTSWSNPNAKTTTEYYIRYEFTGVQIGGKKAILYIPLICDEKTDHIAAVEKRLFKQPVLQISNW